MDILARCATDIALDRGDAVALAETTLAEYGGPQLTAETLPRLRVGDYLVLDGTRRFQALARQAWPLAGTGVFYWLVSTLSPLRLGPDLALSREREGLSLAWITLSDKGAAGLREDASGPLVETICREAFPVSLARGFVLPDEARAIKALLTDLALVQGFDLVLTTGGTGLAPRDVTPEATMAVIEKRLFGLEQAMMAASLQKTPHAAISRAVAGTLGGSILCNLPGSPRAVRENLAAVLPALPHALAKLQGDPADCGQG